MTNVSHCVYIWGQWVSPRYKGELKEALSYVTAITRLKFDEKKHLPSDCCQMRGGKQTEGKISEVSHFRLLSPSRLDRKTGTFSLLRGWRETSCQRL